MTSTFNDALQDNPDVPEQVPEQALDIPNVLPIEQMYDVRIGNRSYQISGASLSSDSPSYFTSYFLKKENADSTIFIDRSPEVFDKILQHLQGYHIEAATPLEFVYLFQDAFYYNLPNLKELLFHSDIYAVIGGQDFRFSKKLISSAGNSPNFFTITYSTLFRDPTSLAGLKKLIRPPPQAPISLPDRCPKLFEMILSLLQGVEVKIATDDLRNSLIRECKYYRFLELEQNLVLHVVRFNPFTFESELVLNLKDVRRKHLLMAHAGDLEMASFASTVANIEGYENIRYKRPYVDDVSRVLIIQLNCNCTYLSLEGATGPMRVKFANEVGTQVQSLLRNFIADQSTRDSFRIMENEASKVKFSLLLPGMVDQSTYVRINGVEMKENWMSNLREQELNLTITKSQWKVQVNFSGVTLVATKLEGVTSQFGWQKKMEYLE